MIPPVTPVGPLNSLIAVVRRISWRTGSDPITVVRCREDRIAEGLWSDWIGAG